MTEVIVAKAGGTSNADAAAVEQSLGWAERSDIFVASAPGRLAETQQITVESKVTDQLLAAYATAGSTRERHIHNVTERFSAIVHGLGARSLADSWVDRIPERIREAAGQDEDSASMLGERLQAEIYASVGGFTLLDPALAPHDLGNRPEAWRGWLSQATARGQRYVLIGNTTLENRRLRTFSRGGSDTSIGMAGYGIRADLHLNLTDHGAMSTDPGYEGMEFRAKPVRHMLYQEGRELGRNGTGLLHPAAMVPLMMDGIPTQIRSIWPSTRGRPGHFTTVDNDIERAERRTGRTIAMSLMEDVVMYRVHEPGMAEALGRLAVFDNELSRRGIALYDSQGDGVDGQRYFIEAEYADAARRALEQAVMPGGSVESINDGKPLHFLTLVGYRLDTRLLDYTSHLISNWGVNAKEWQREGHDFSHGRHSFRISLPSREEALDTLRRLHASLIENPRRAPVTLPDSRHP